ncbi:hypothetical protein BH09PSE3_BH09PSE3_10090 [soil metagenome]
MRGVKTLLSTIAVTLLAAPGAAMATTATASATVVTVQPLSLVKSDDLDFGSMIATATAGTVKIDPSTDVRTTTGGVVVAGGTPAAARFVAAGLVNVLGIITLPTSITLNRTGGGGTMTIGTVTTNGSNIRLFAGPILDVRVGGTLSVGANQPAGDYVGTFNITVVYL